jgi:hypothetical protein
MTPPQLAVVVPAFNEAQRLTENLLTLLGYLQSYRPEAELIVVDDGSTDGTAQVAEELFLRRPDVMARVLRFAVNRGKGHAVRAGLLAAQAPIAVFSDADLSTPFTELPKIVEPIEAGKYDIVFGSRALDRSLIGHRQPWRREQGGKVFNGIVRLTTGLPFFDTQCGFKHSGWKPPGRSSSRHRSMASASTSNCSFLAQRAGLRMLEVPVRWDHNEGSKVQIVHDSLRMFAEVVSFAHAGCAWNTAVRGCGGVALRGDRRAHPKTVKSFSKQFVRLTLAFCCRCRRQGGTGSPARHSGESSGGGKRRGPPVAPGFLSNLRFPRLPPSVPTPTTNVPNVPASVNDTARFLAGLPVSEGSPLAAPHPESGMATTRHFLRSGLDQTHRAPVCRAFVTGKSTTCPDATQPLPVVFYMFSGPDFLYAHQFFPNASTYILAGTEPIGPVPDVMRFAGLALEPVLLDLQKSLNSVLSFSFFITKDMRTDLQREGLKGTLPIFYVFLARAGENHHRHHLRYPRQKRAAAARRA